MVGRFRRATTRNRESNGAALASVGIMSRPPLSDLICHVGTVSWAILSRAPRGAAKHLTAAAVPSRSAAARVGLCHLSRAGDLVRPRPLWGRGDRDEGIAGVVPRSSRCSPRLDGRGRDEPDDVPRPEPGRPRRASLGKARPTSPLTRRSTAAPCSRSATTAAPSAASASSRALAARSRACPASVR